MAAPLDGVWIACNECSGERRFLSSMCRSMSHVRAMTAAEWMCRLKRVVIFMHDEPFATAVPLGHLKGYGASDLATLA